MLGVVNWDNKKNIFGQAARKRAIQGKVRVKHKLSGCSYPKSVVSQNRKIMFRRQEASGPKHVHTYFLLFYRHSLIFKCKAPNESQQ